MSARLDVISLQTSQVITICDDMGYFPVLAHLGGDRILAVVRG